MKREANGFEAYKDITRSVGVPTKTVADNAQILIGTKQTNINPINCIDIDQIVPHHQHQDYCEIVGEKFKFAGNKLFHNTPFSLLRYWYYAVFGGKQDSFLNFNRWMMWVKIDKRRNWRNQNLQLSLV